MNREQMKEFLAQIEHHCFEESFVKEGVTIFGTSWMLKDEGADWAIGKLPAPVVALQEEIGRQRTVILSLEAEIAKWEAAPVVDEIVSVAFIEEKIAFYERTGSTDVQAALIVLLQEARHKKRIRKARREAAPVVDEGREVLEWVSNRLHEPGQRGDEELLDEVLEAVDAALTAPEQPCDMCGGMEVLVNPERPCPKCAALAAPEQEGDMCEWCSGTGVIPHPPSPEEGGG